MTRFLALLALLALAYVGSKAPLDVVAAALAGAVLLAMAPTWTMLQAVRACRRAQAQTEAAVAALGAGRPAGAGEETEIGEDVVLPEGRLIRVSYELCLPAAASKADIDAWVGLALGCDSLETDSPLSRFEPEPFGDRYTLTDTGMIGRRHTEVLEEGEGPRRYCITYTRERA